MERMCEKAVKAQQMLKGNSPCASRLRVCVAVKLSDRNYFDIILLNLFCNLLSNIFLQYGEVSLEPMKALPLNASSQGWERGGDNP